MADKEEFDMDELQDDLLLGSDDEEEIISDLDDDMILDEDTLKIAEAYLSDEEEEEDIDFGSEDEEEEAELDFEDRPKRRFYDEEDVEVEDEINYFESRKPSQKLMLHEGRKPRHLREYRIRNSRPTRVIQGNYGGYGWEDVCEYDEDEFKNIKHDLGEYRASRDGLSYRVINRREKLNKPQQFIKGKWVDIEEEPVKETNESRKPNMRKIRESRKLRKSRMMKEAVRQARRNHKLQESRKMRSPFSKRRFR